MIQAKSPAAGRWLQGPCLLNQQMKGSLLQYSSVRIVHTVRTPCFTALMYECLRTMRTVRTIHYPTVGVTCLRHQRRSRKLCVRQSTPLQTAMVFLDSESELFELGSPFSHLGDESTGLSVRSGPKSRRTSRFHLSPIRCSSGRRNF